MAIPVPVSGDRPGVHDQAAAYRSCNDRRESHLDRDALPAAQPDRHLRINHLELAPCELQCRNILQADAKVGYHDRCVTFWRTATPPNESLDGLTVTNSPADICGVAAASTMAAASHRVAYEPLLLPTWGKRCIVAVSMRICPTGEKIREKAAGKLLQARYKYYLAERDALPELIHNELLEMQPKKGSISVDEC